MRADEIRSSFLRFFEERGHRVVSSSPVVPQDDPTLLFTNAGMNQFKDAFLGREARDYSRACSSQKCIRAGGKHNDLEEVGRTARHQTFFEMLGNFSFGDYFKRDAIRFAWEYLTDVVELPKSRLWVTIFREDDEAFELWRSETDLPEGRIVRCGEKDNFWQMGDTGPCGPCTEIHYDPRGEADAQPGFDDEACLEVWNLVFMQFDRQPDGQMVPLPKPSVDTGMGLERLASLLQGVGSNYETDLLRPLVDEVARLSGVAYDPGPAGVPHRVIADHVRALTFAFADGALPSNEGRGYVLRRILRRAARHGRNLGVEEAFLYRLVPTVREIMGDAFGELAPRTEHVQHVIRDEERSFNQTLDRGLQLFETAARGAEAGATFSGDVAWDLFSTFGFPPDLTRVLCSERGLGFDEAGFEAKLAAERERSRGAQRFRGRDLSVHGDVPPTEFTGYQEETTDAEVASFAADRGELVLSRTPFYAEAGGQVGDRGWIRAADGSFAFRVRDTQKAGGVWLHLGELESGDPAAVVAGAAVRCEVDASRRTRIRKNHTATHLLHWALHEVVGGHAQQAGSVVEPDRLRFDFTHPRPLTDEEIEAIERRVNQKVLADCAVETKEQALEEAKASGVTALFGEKYGDRVRVVSVAGFSRELCGGTHVRRTGEIGLFKVTQETAVQAGVRRVVAITGPAAVDWALSAHRTLRALSRRLSVPEDRVLERVVKTQEQAREWKRKAKEALKAGGESGSATAAGPEIDEDLGGVRFQLTQLEAPVPELKRLGDRVKQAKEPVFGLYIGLGGKKLSLVAAASKAAVGRGVKAADVLRAVTSALGGGGGGRPDMAQAGGLPAKSLDEAVRLAREAVLAAR